MTWDAAVFCAFFDPPLRQHMLVEHNAWQAIQQESDIPEEQSINWTDNQSDMSFKESCESTVACERARPLQTLEYASFIDIHFWPPLHMDNSTLVLGGSFLANGKCWMRVDCWFIFLAFCIPHPDNVFKSLMAITCIQSGTVYTWLLADSVFHRHCSM